jgi:hypothetical protein
VAQAILGFSGATCTHAHENPCLQPWVQVSMGMGYGFHKTHRIFDLYINYNTIIYRNITYSNIKNKTKRRNACMKQSYMRFGAVKGQGCQNWWISG